MSLENLLFAQRTIVLVRNALDQVYSAWLKLPKTIATVPEEDYPFRGTMSHVITLVGQWQRRAERSHTVAHGPKDWMPTSPVDVKRPPTFLTKKDLEPSGPLSRKGAMELRFLSRVAALFQHFNELAWIIDHLERHEQKAIMQGYPLKAPLDLIIERVETWYRTLDRRFEEAA